MRQLVDINSAISLDPLTVDKFATEVREMTKDFPDICEGVRVLMGVECFFTCRVESDRIVVNVAPRDQAEALLNKLGLSTHEPWSPWPGRTDTAWGKPKGACEGAGGAGDSP
jgi:hypothetical protein